MIKGIKLNRAIYIYLSKLERCVTNKKGFLYMYNENKPKGFCIFIVDDNHYISSCHFHHICMKLGLIYDNEIRDIIVNTINKMYNTRGIKG